MKTFVNILKGIGITFAVLVGLILYQCTGPHSPEAVLKEMREFKADADKRESAAERHELNAINTSNSAERKSYYEQATLAYGDAEAAWREFLGDVSKLSRYDQTKRYEQEARELAERKIAELDEKEKRAFAASKTSPSPQASESDDENSTASSTSSTDDQCGKIISDKAFDIAYSRLGEFFTNISLPEWQKASNAERCQIAHNICEKYTDVDSVKTVAQELGGTAPLRDAQEAGAIMIASMQTLCPDKYPEFLRSLQRSLSQ